MRTNGRSYMSETMSLAEAVRVLRLTRATVRTLLEDRTLAGFRVRKTIRISRASVLRLMASGAGLGGETVADTRPAA